MPNTHEMFPSGHRSSSFFSVFADVRSCALNLFLNTLEEFVWFSMKLFGFQGFLEISLVKFHKWDYFPQQPKASKSGDKLAQH